MQNVEMVQTIRNFAEGLRRGLGIRIHCVCGKQVIHRCADFCNVIAPAAQIEELVFRCSWCGERARYVRYTALDGLDRESLSQWMRTKKPS